MNKDGGGKKIGKNLWMSASFMGGPLPYITKICGQSNYIHSFIIYLVSSSRDINVHCHYRGGSQIPPQRKRYLPAPPRSSNTYHWRYEGSSEPRCICSKSCTYRHRFLPELTRYRAQGYPVQNQAGIEWDMGHVTYYSGI